MRKQILAALLGFLLLSGCGAAPSTAPESIYSSLPEIAVVESSTAADIEQEEPIPIEELEPSQDEVMQNHPEQPTAPVLDGSTPISPWDYQNLLGRGVDVDWSGNRRGKQYYNVQAVKDFKSAGVSHVRIRMIDDANEELLAGLDKQILDCLENGLIPVIAYHGGDFETNPSQESLQRTVDWWKTVANRYKDYSHLLAFDLIIEVSDALNKQPEILNEFYEQAVTEIRKTNPTRIIMISPRLRSDASYLQELKVPTMHNGYLMAEWHFYASGPSREVERKLWTTGTAAEKQLILDKIGIALNWQKQTGIPTWVGAWMPGNYNEGNTYTIDEQVIFADFMTQSLTEANIPFAVNSDTKFYDRETNQWISEMQPVFHTIFPDTHSTTPKVPAFNTNTQAQAAIKVGFHAKATPSYEEQCMFVGEEFQKLKESGVRTDKIWLRLNGGTVSQKTYPADWSDKIIGEWVELQQKFGCSYVFVVNLNDSAKSQWGFYQKLKQNGIKFRMVELGNEQYLPKFAEPYTGKDDEVSKHTSNMTAKKYIKLCNEYIELFKSQELPFYVQFAPEREEKNNYTQWNSDISKAINEGAFASSNINGTIHLYERDGSETLDETQIKRIRSLVKKPITLAVTEFGVADKRKELPYDQFIVQEKALTNRIIGQLQGGDLLFNQVLYTGYKTAAPEIFHPAFDGITPKGEMMLELFQPYWQ